MNGTQALFVNPSPFNCVSGKNLCPASKKLQLCHSLYTFKIEEGLSKEFDFKVFLFLSYLVIL